MAETTTDRPSPAEVLDGLGLSEARANAFAAIVEGRRAKVRRGKPDAGPPPPAWTKEEHLVEAGHAVGILEDLERLGLAASWQLPPIEGTPGPGPRMWTVSPWGCWLAEREVQETAIVRGGELIETPILANLGTPVRPVMMPRQLGHVGMTRPDLLLDPSSVPFRRYEDEEPGDRTPRPFMDPLTNKPMVLFGSVPVTLDARAVRKASAKPRKSSPKSADEARRKAVERRRRVYAKSLAKGDDKRAG